MSFDHLSDAGAELPWRCMCVRMRACHVLFLREDIRLSNNQHQVHIESLIERIRWSLRVARIRSQMGMSINRPSAMLATVFLQRQWTQDKTIFCRESLKTPFPHCKLFVALFRPSAVKYHQGSQWSQKTNIGNKHIVSPSWTVWLCTPTSLHLATFGIFCGPTTACAKLIAGRKDNLRDFLQGSRCHRWKASCFNHAADKDPRTPMLRIKWIYH